MLTYLETMPDRDIVVVTEDGAWLARDIRVMLDLSGKICDTGARLEFCDENAVANIAVSARIQFTGTRGDRDSNSCYGANPVHESQFFAAITSA